MQRVRASLVLGIVLLAAGCLGDGRTTGCSSPCTTENDGAQSGSQSGQTATEPGSGPEAPFASLPFVEFDECQGVGLGLEVPADTVAGAIPSDFGPASSVPFMAHLGVLSFDCPRVALTNAVAENVTLLISYVNVIPREDDAADDGLHFYTFDVMTNHEVVSSVLSRHGIPSVVASISREAHSIAAGLVAETRTVTGADMTYEISFLRDDSAGTGTYEMDRHHWFGSDPYNRMDVHHQDQVSSTLTVDVGTIQASGAAGLASVLPMQPVPAYGSWLTHLEWNVELINEQQPEVNT